MGARCCAWHFNSIPHNRGFSIWFADRGSQGSERLSGQGHTLVTEPVTGPGMSNSKATALFSTLGCQQMKLLVASSSLASASSCKELRPRWRHPPTPPVWICELGKLRQGGDGLTTEGPGLSWVLKVPLLSSQGL